jgi:hypothetical protein
MVHGWLSMAAVQFGLFVLEINLTREGQQQLSRVSLCFWLQ